MQDRPAAPAPLDALIGRRSLAMPVIWSTRHRGHAPGGGYWLGIHEPGDEEPERGDVLRLGMSAADRIG